jgi:hypothetical protein
VKFLDRLINEFVDRVCAFFAGVLEAVIFCTKRGNVTTNGTNQHEQGEKAGPTLRQAWHCQPEAPPG